jgi:hypothetical protein
LLSHELFPAKANQEQHNRRSDSGQKEFKDFGSATARDGHQDNSNPDQQNRKEDRNVLHGLTIMPHLYNLGHTRTGIF